MPRKPTKAQMINQLLKNHSGYTPSVWVCTGRHKERIHTLNPTVPRLCREGHAFVKKHDISMNLYLKTQIENIRKNYGK
jgi:hypothetical protein